MPDILQASKQQGSVGPPQGNDSASPPPGIAPSPPSEEPRAAESDKPQGDVQSVVDSVLEAASSASPPPSPTTAEPGQPPPPEPPPLVPSSLPKKQVNKGVLLTVLLFLLITLPLGMYYVSQQKQLADLRSRAAFPSEDGGGGGGGDGGTVSERDKLMRENSPSEIRAGQGELGGGGTNEVGGKIGNVKRPAGAGEQEGTGMETGTTTTDGGKIGNVKRPAGAGEQEGTGMAVVGTTQTPLLPDWESCTGGGQCASGKCGIDPGDNSFACLPKTSTIPPAQEYCRGVLHADCVNGCEADVNGGHCRQPVTTTPGPSGGDGGGGDGRGGRERDGGGGDGGGGTPTPTPGPSGPQCLRINVYKGNGVVNPSTLKAGDNVVLSVAAGTASRGRIRVNGGAWNETTTKNTNEEFTVPFTIPTGTINFTIEAEIFANGQWR